MFRLGQGRWAFFRHLDNFLLDTQVGQLIPIDFGHAFGSSTEVQEVPELMPFRLTRQLQLVTQPVGVVGSLKDGLVCSTFRQE